MPSLLITINHAVEIRVNLPISSTRALCIDWVGDSDPDEEEQLSFHIGGIDGEERINWVLPKLLIGDEIAIKISDENTIDTETLRTPRLVQRE